MSKCCVSCMAHVTMPPYCPLTFNWLTFSFL